MKERINLNNGWTFVAGNYDLNKKKLSKKAKPTNVTVPHIVERAETETKGLKKGVYWYKKDFVITPENVGKQAVLEFEGVMNVAYVYVNGKRVCEHYCGYTEFAVDITKYLNSKSSKPQSGGGRLNTLVLKVITDEQSCIPVGKKENEIDFLYYGGVYRNVNLVFYDSVHITNPMITGSTASDGIQMLCESVTKDLAVTNARINVANDGNRAQKTVVSVKVVDKDGNTLDTFISNEVNIKKGGRENFAVVIKQRSPQLWSPNFPYLYTYVFDVIANGIKVDTEFVTRGIRTVSVDHRGLILNGCRTALRGVTRHEQMPYIGNALSNEMQYRDAFKIKKAGFNLVKLGFYTQSRAFIEACDELGLMVIDVCPGYQHMEKGLFKEILKENVAAMARRDRNATSVIIWQPTPSQVSKANGSGATDKFYAELNCLLREELKYSCSPLISGDTAGRIEPEKVANDMPYCESDYATKERNLDKLPGRKGLVADYGDYEFGGSESISRVDRGDEGGELLQAWCMQWQHNRNNRNPDICGDILTEAFDHNRGIATGAAVAKSGIMDMFRLPKFSYEFFRSQDERRGAKMVFAPTYWDNENIDKLIVYSNCDKVRVFINDKFIEEREADAGAFKRFVPYTKKEILAFEKEIKDSVKKNIPIAGRHWALPVGKELLAGRISPIVYHMTKTMWDGGNCDRLSHAPFTFDNIVYSPGKLVIEGLVNGEIVATQTIMTPGVAVGLRIVNDYSNKALVNDGVDTIFVRAEIIDRNGTIVRSEVDEIEFELDGAEFVGDSVVKTVGGIATTMIRAIRGADKVSVVAVSRTQLRSRKIGVALNRAVEINS